MEDQRNWTDNSYKTYCRPLELPFPYTLKKGDRIHQRIAISVQDGHESISGATRDYQLSYNSSQFLPLPKIGIGKRRDYQLTNQEIGLLKKVGFDHYDVDIVFNESCKPEIEKALLEAKELDLSLKLKIWFSDNYKKEIDLLARIIGFNQERISSILILESGEMVTSDQFLSNVIPSIKKVFPQAKIRAGTISNFAELNRNRIRNTNLDFIAFSMNPQDHAFDNLTLVEILKGQSATVEKARSFATEKKIHISPITFKIQKQPAVSHKETREELLEQIDMRKMSLFGAGWTLGSIKHLAEGSA